MVERRRKSTVLFANPAYRLELNRDYEQYFFCAGSRCPWSLVKKKSELPRYAMFPFMMGYAAAVLEENGVHTVAIDAIPLNLSEEDFINQVIESDPGIIVFEPVTTAIEYVAGIAARLKVICDATIIFTGSHITALPEESLKKYHHVDFLILGEYEFSLLELVKALSGDEPIEMIKGLGFRKGKENVINGKAGILHIDELPFPARHLFPSFKNKDLSLYHDGFCQNRPALQMHSSRGCPFRCKFCLWTQVIYDGNRYRMFSAERVVDEMILLRDNFNAREIYIDDDTFTGNKKHVLDICHLMGVKNLKVPWSVMGDAMICDEEMIIAMKKAGCIGIKFGLESADTAILHDIRKPLHTERLYKLIRLCNKLRIKTHVTVSFGHIQETNSSITNTMNYVNSLPSDSIQFSIATPYPGTVFYEEALQKGYLPNADQVSYDPTHASILNLPGISKQELVEIQAASHGLWLKKKLVNPSWVFRQSLFLLYIMRSQGFSGFLKRGKRAWLLLFSTNFR